MRPTEMARALLDMAQHRIASAKDAKVNEMPSDLIDTLNFLIQALSAMSVGLRATYIKLEQIEALIKSTSKP